MIFLSYSNEWGKPFQPYWKFPIMKILIMNSCKTN